MRIAIVTSLIAFAVLAADAANADPRWGGDDIVWPTYQQVGKITDDTLNCNQLQAEIDKVSADIKVLDDARHKIDKNIRDVFNMQDSSGPGVFKSSFGGQGGYPAARKKIVASQKIANARRDYLVRRQPTCKPAVPSAPPASLAPPPPPPPAPPVPPPAQ
jgi:hypothetical protein